MDQKNTRTKKIKVQNQHSENQNDDGWEDSHDEEINIDLSKVNSRRKFIVNNQSIVSGKQYRKKLRDFYDKQIQNQNFLKWAQNESNQEQDQDLFGAKAQTLQDLLAVPLANQNQKVFKSGELNIQKMGFVRKDDRPDAVIQTISFHNHLPIFIVGSYDKVIRIYQISEKNKDFDENIIVNMLLKTIGLEKFPISKAEFSYNSDKIIVSSFKHNYLIALDYIHNKKTIIQSQVAHLQQVEPSLTSINKKKLDFIIKEEDDSIAVFYISGYIFILDGQHYGFQCQFKQNDPCLSACFYQDYLLSTSPNGKIYQWSLSNKKIHNIIQFPGGLQINSIHTNNDFLVIGSSSGIVSIFEFDKIKQTFKNEPIKEIQNLQHSITQVGFNNNNLICEISKWKENAVRLIQCETLQVVRNWPTLKTNLKFINTFAFSKDSKYLVFGNQIGETIVYRLNN